MNRRNIGLSTAAASGDLATLVAKAKTEGATKVALREGGPIRLPAVVEAGRKAGLTFVQTGPLEGLLLVDHRPLAG